MDFKLSDVAPRLAKAHAQRRIELRDRERRRQKLITRELHLRRIEAHRDLQYVRAMSTGSGKYIGQRYRKLEAIRRELAQVQSRLKVMDRVDRERR